MSDASLHEPVAALLRDEVIAAVLPGHEIDPTANLFELGADSLALIRLVNRTNLVFEVEVDAAAFFQQPTGELLARLVVAQLDGDLTEGTPR
ncbi:acyl carrier protein [Micromonospora sp. WMMD1082]|uniref:acyl carrier protein n=1 Tax=Micromonospora sp. WMMD1082 TaxID=3016104 RepID=UPI0024172002|nr:acyl carrier protein [Micromonospora sp. WMMD1082]MDG4797012.1 acyl carrier protein [Micromonospora sp. WMMD1082]